MSTPLSSMNSTSEMQAPSWWALIVGLCLAAVPIVHFSSSGHEHSQPSAGEVDAPSDPHAEHALVSDNAGNRRAHTDHTPHHGGQLGMVGRIHVELVENGDAIEVHLSNARRRPIAPTRGTVRFDDGNEQPLATFAAFMLAPVDKDAREVTVRVAPRAQAEKLVEISFVLRSHSGVQ